VAAMHSAVIATANSVLERQVDRPGKVRQRSLLPGGDVEKSPDHLDGQAPISVPEDDRMCPFFAAKYTTAISGRPPGYQEHQGRRSHRLD